MRTGERENVGGWYSRATGWEGQKWLEYYFELITGSKSLYFWLQWVSKVGAVSRMAVAILEWEQYRGKDDFGCTDGFRGCERLKEPMTFLGLYARRRAP